MAFSDLLAVDIVQGVVDDLADINQLPQPLVWAGKRIPIVPALDGEILARYTGQIFAADLIMDDQKAVVRSLQPYRLQQTVIPKLKHGVSINEEMLNIISRIEANQASNRDLGVFENYLARIVTDQRDGVYARMEALCVAMLCESFTYNRMGVIVNSASWGTPAAGKVVVSNLWTDVTNADPLNDILTVRNNIQFTYGITLNRVTMSLTAFNYAIATNAFKNRLPLIAPILGFAANAYPSGARGRLRDYFEQMLDPGMEIEFYDRSVWVESVDGSKTATRYLPTNKVLLTTTESDGNRAFHDFANGELLETRPGMVPALIGSFDGPRDGPVAYVTAADSQGNPPGMVTWGAGRGFPRKHREAGSAVLTVL